MGQGTVAIGTAGGFGAGGGFPPGGTVGGWIIICCGAHVIPLMDILCEVMTPGAELIGIAGVDRLVALNEGPAVIPEGAACCFPFEVGGVGNALVSADVGLG